MSDTASLVLRFAAPLQAWGAASRFIRRDTRAEPSKSGVIGLLAAAQGRRRCQPIDDLAAATVGVRTDRAGEVLRDYHTVSDYRGQPLLSTATNAKGQQKRTTYPNKVTTRYYLSDAVFVVAVHHLDRYLLKDLAAALAAPAFPLSLGRRSCPPTQPLHLRTAEGKALWAGDASTVLAAVPFQAPGRATAGQLSVTLPVTVDDPAGADWSDDQPTSFGWAQQRHTARPVSRTFVTLPADPAVNVADLDTGDGHDPFSLLG